MSMWPPVAAWLLLGASFSAAQEPAPAAVADPLLENLEGTDAEKGSLAARDLLAQIVDKASRKREPYLLYLRGALRPERVAQNGPGLRVAERLVAAFAYTASSGQPFPPEGVELVLKLIGVGADGLKKVVHDGLIAFARAERSSGGSSIVTALGTLVQRDVPPVPSHLEEVADILWRIDGKELLRSLIGVLSRNKTARRSELGPFTSALRQRLGIGFATIEEWERWWEENQDRGIQVILEAAHRQSRLRHVELWRKTFRRIEGAADPEAYLGAIADVLELDPSSELRSAAVEALGGFHDWMRDSRFPVDKNGAPTIDEGRKAAYLARGLAALVKHLDDGAGPGFTSPALRRKALVALRAYAPYLSRMPSEEAAVGAALLHLLRAALPEGVEGAPPPLAPRADLLELVRTAGALRIPSSRLYLERILREESARGPEGMDLAVEAVGALGRVLERGVAREPVELILRTFRAHQDLAPREAPERGPRDLRLACVSALNLRIDDPELRSDVRRFYNEVLGLSQDRVGKVPAIIGLGILAKGTPAAAGAVPAPGEGIYREAVADLGSLLQRRAEFAPAEAAAAVDALAYLGGKEAMEQLIPFLNAKDSPFAEHVRRKAVTLLKGHGIDLLRFTLLELEVQAYRLDQPDLMGVILQLAEEPELAALLAPERGGGAKPEEFVAFWECSLVQLRALETTADEARAQQVLAALSDLWIKNGRLKDVRPQGEEEMARARARLERRQEARASLVREPAPGAEGAAQALLEVVVPTEGIEDRWRALRWLLLQVQVLKPGPESARLAEVLLAALSPGAEDARAAAVWSGSPPEARARYLKTLESLRDKLKSPPAAGSGQ